MSISGIYSDSIYTNMLFGTSSVQSQAATSSGANKTDSVSLSSEAMDLYKASQAEKAAAVTALSSQDNNAESDFADDSSAQAESSLGEQAQAGGMRPKGGRPSGGSSEDDDDDTESTEWYEDWYETTIGLNADEESKFAAYMQDDIA